MRVVVVQDTNQKIAHAVMSIDRRSDAGLTAENIMQEAKIISETNACVAISSARVYRPGLPVNEVMDKLLEQADHAFDRNVIAALFHIAENRSDWTNWQVVQMS